MRPLFIGDSEIDQIFKIFKVFGTPDEDVWPGVTLLKDFKLTFPQFKELGLSEVIKNIDLYALDLIKQMLVLNPTKRISAKRALKHPFFKDYIESQKLGIIQLLEGDKNEDMHEDLEEIF